IMHSPASYLIFAPGMPEVLLRRYQQAHVAFSMAPLRMQAVVAQCSGIICHAGGMTDVALESGKPLLLLPTQMEQTMTSRRVEALGAGLSLPLEGNPSTLPKLLQRLLEDSRLRAGAAEYAANAFHTAPSMAVESVIDHCTALLTGSRPCR
ncbi:MAG: glycosyl transferase related to UDP-glucuronosyltransferase-like protein, partial [Halothiobacillaceae bacterium]